MTKKKSDQPASPVVKNQSVLINIDWSEIKPVKAEVESKLAKQIKLDGFRPGKVPIQVARQYLSPESVIEQTLHKLLPKKFLSAIEQVKEKPIAEPEYRVENTEEGKEWKITAEYASAPEVNVKSYEQLVKTVAKKTKPAGDTKKTEDDQLLGEIYRALVEKFGPKIPELLVKREAQSQLKELVHQLKYRQTSLEQYLVTTKQKFEDLTAQMAGQALGRLQLNFVLDQMAKEAKIEVKDEEIHQQLKERAHDPYLRRFVSQTLLRQKIADYLLQLAKKK